MPRFSLIMATKGRTDEVRAYLASLAAQSYSDFELIIVDQNDDDRLAPILASFTMQEKIVHLKSEPGLSKSRNKALKLVTGEIIAFPDDDCWYPTGLLTSVDKWFAENPEYGILTMTVRDEEGELSANKWKAEACDIAPINIFRTTASYSLFIRRSPLAQGVIFDEDLGVGCKTPFGSGEDTDFVLHLMKKGIRGRFISTSHVGHPRRDMFSGAVTPDRAYSYGLGMGRVLGKHSLPLLGAALFSFDVLRAVRGFCMGRFEGSNLCWMHGRGILMGYVARENSSAM